MRYLIFGLLLLPVLASAEIYRWTDAQGQVHFSEKNAGMGAQPVQVKLQVIERDSATREREQRAAKYFGARREERVAAQSRAATARAKRRRECDGLRSRLREIERDGRYFQINANGERAYYSTDDINAERSRLSSKIAAQCR